MEYRGAIEEEEHYYGMFLQRLQLGQLDQE